MMLYCISEDFHVVNLNIVLNVWHRCRRSTLTVLSTASTMMASNDSYSLTMSVLPTKESTLVLFRANKPPPSFTYHVRITAFINFQGVVCKTIRSNSCYIGQTSKLMFMQNNYWFLKIRLVLVVIFHDRFRFMSLYLKILRVLIGNGVMFLFCHMQIVQQCRPFAKSVQKNIMLLTLLNELSSPWVQQALFERASG